MNELGYSETKLPKNWESKTAVVWKGGFSPFHLGHWEQYKKLKRSFGNLPVFIAIESAKDSRGKDFPIEKRKRIIEAGYPIPKDRIIETGTGSFKQLKSALPKYDVFILAVGHKDKDRKQTKGTIFDVKSLADVKKVLSDGILKKMQYVIPENEKHLVSATQIRSSIDLIKKYIPKKSRSILLESKEIRIKHIDDILYSDNISDSVNKIKDYINSLLSDSGRFIVNQKIDGRPAIVFGKQKGRFFISIKRSVELKTPEVFYEPSEIQKSTKMNEGLKALLIKLYDPLKNVTKNGMWVAELLWAKDTTVPGYKNVDNGMISFKPNMVTYTIDGRKDPHAKKAEFGLVVTGSLRKNGNSFSKDYSSHPKESDISKTGNVWWTDPKIKVINIKNVKYITTIQRLLTKLDDISSTGISTKLLKDLNIQEFISSRLKGSELTKLIGDKAKFIDGLKDYINTKYKIEKTKIEKMSLLEKNKSTINKWLDAYQTINDIKDSLVKQVDKVAPLKATGGTEGFVILDKDQPIKFVPKIGFTNTNFLSRKIITEQRFSNFIR